MAGYRVLSGSFIACVFLTTQATASFNPLQHLGAQSPFFSAPAQYGVSAEAPSGCTVDQAAYLLRHGSRYPSNGAYNGWVSLYNKLQNATFTANGPLEFLPIWSPPLDDPVHQVEMLSGTGTLEAFQLGVQLKFLKLTKPNTQLTVWSASQQRCVDTAQWFLQGYNSAGHYDVPALGRIITMADSVNYTFANSLTSTNSCPRYVTNETYANNYRDQLRIPIITRLNKYLKGLTLNAGDIGTMMDLCGFQTEVAGSSPFCAVFTEDEWKDFEYAMDLQYYYGSGPGNPYSATTFWPYLKAVTDLFAVGPGKTTAASTSGFIPPALLMSFSHDNDITPLISALGIFNESSYAPLHPTKPKSNRKFRASYAITFGGRVALERMTCDNKGQFVRVRVNDAVVPLKDCVSGPGHTCSLRDFIKYVDKRGQVVGDFVKTCGQTAPNATSLFTAFIDPASVL